MGNSCLHTDRNRSNGATGYRSSTIDPLASILSHRSSLTDLGMGVLESERQRDRQRNRKKRGRLGERDLSRHFFGGRAPLAIVPPSQPDAATRWTRHASRCAACPP
eukprot:scaffold368_cov258-Pinguiococcus_pyrenoidosus.AAC.78